MSPAENNDAEKGILDVRPSHYASNLGLANNEKKPVGHLVSPFNVVKPLSQPPKPNKIKITKYVYFIIWYNSYKRFFTVVFTLNFIALGFATAGLWPYAQKYPGALAAGNLNVAVLMRNEIFGRLLYLFVNTLFARWTPLWFRLACSSTLQHLGGIHSSCAISGVAWLILTLVNQFKVDYVYNDSLLVFGILSCVTLFITIIAGLPCVRYTHHNIFERSHRFFGWTALLMTWVYTILANTYDVTDEKWDHSGVYIVHQQAFWYTMGLTLLIVLPWISTRNIRVDVELPSQKVAVLRFERGIQQGLLTRISRSMVMEYHAFGIISEGPYAKYHYLICGVQGDFTRSLVNDPPRRIWTRQLKFAGVFNTSTLYKRGISVCTGTGLGAALSTCIQSPHWYLIWIGSDQEKTFGPTISGLIHQYIEPERLLLWDSKACGGRPDMMKILKEVYDYWQAEVVIITSNYAGSLEMQHGCKALGIPAFGALRDY